MVITSMDNPKIKEYRKLQQKKYRDRTSSFLVEGMHLVLEAYKEGLIQEVILEENQAIPLDVPIVYTTQEIIEKLSSLDSPVSVLAVCRKKQEFLELGRRILLLDDIQDPGNLGTIIRSAVAFDVSTLVLSNNCVDIYHPKVLRATQGMIFHLNIIRKDLKEIIAIIKDQEIPLYGTNVEYGEDVRRIRDKKSYALVVGNEGNGVHEEIKDLCDQNLKIAMNNKVESLNVGVATSILLYELQGGIDNESMDR